MAMNGPSDETVPDVDTVELPILDKPYEMLVWPNSPIRHPRLCRLSAPCSKDGIYHVILNAISIYYRTQSYRGYKVSKDELVTLFRRELAMSIGVGPPGRRPYDLLGAGAARALSVDRVDYSMRAMQEQLMFEGFIPEYLISFVCDQIGHDIVYVSGLERDVASFPYQTEDAIKCRPTIIVLFTRNHYELIGLMNNDQDIDTVFDPNHLYIKLLRERLGMEEVSELND